MTEEEKTIKAVREVANKWPRSNYSTVIGNRPSDSPTLTFISYNDTNSSIEFRACAWRQLQMLYAGEKNRLKHSEVTARVISSEPIPGPHNLRRVVVSIKVKDK